MDKNKFVNIFSFVVLICGVSACFSTYALGVKIPYFDYDDSTQGMFINDLTFRNGFDASFKGKQEPQEAYRTRFAAQRLSYSLPFSWLQSITGLSHWEVEVLLRWATIIFCFAGSFFAACVLLTGSKWSVGELLFLIATLVVHPSLALFVRTGASFYIFVYALFWLGLFAGFRWLTSNKAIWIYFAGGVAGICLLNPYPPFVCLPIAAFLFVLWNAQFRTTFGNAHLYAAGVGALVLSLCITYLLATWYDSSFETFLGRLSAFRADRGHSIALSSLSVDPIQKMEKWVNQQWLFRVDGFGDRSRDDFMWVLEARQLSIFLWIIPVVLGLLVALRERLEHDRRALAIVGAIIILFISVSFPEGRYTLILLPCWAYFSLRGINHCIRNKSLRHMVLGAMLLILAVDTERSIRRVYMPKIQQAWIESEGIREAAPYMSTLPNNGQGIMVGMPYGYVYRSDLFFRMVMPEHAVWVQQARFAEMLKKPIPPSGLAALAYMDDHDWVDGLVERGFRNIALFRGEGSGRQMALLWLPQSEQDSKKLRNGNIL